MVERLLERLRVDLGARQDRSQSSIPSQPSRLRFLSEQKGEVESFLESIWSEFFLARPDVASAYLVSVRFDPDEPAAVALCLRTTSSDRDSQNTLVAFISNVFRDMFDPDESLSVIFLSADQERQAQCVAQPFYASGQQISQRQHATVFSQSSQAAQSEGQPLLSSHG